MIVFTEKVLSTIHSFAALGERRLSNGAHLIGHVPHRAPEAYLHILFPPASDALIDDAKSRLSAVRAFDQYTQFLIEYNGADFFLGSLAFHGIREGLISRSSDARQPFDLYELNRFGRPKNADPRCLFIGSYNWDGSLVFVAPSGEVFVCKKRDATPYAHWKNISEMVFYELGRLAQFYDIDGREIDSRAPQTPVPNI